MKCLTNKVNYKLLLLLLLINAIFLVEILHQLHILKHKNTNIIPLDENNKNLLIKETKDVDNYDEIINYIRSIDKSEERKILLKVLNFILEEKDSEDEELVEFVRTLIHAPAAEGERNLKTKKKSDLSQTGQSQYIDELLGSRRDGFYVEAGGWNGEDNSNSLFFEMNRNWSGILIEPFRSNFNVLLDKKRRAFALNACLSEKLMIGKFLGFANSLSGLEASMSESHKIRAKKENEESGAGVYAFVPCFSLVTILKAINVKKVDYFSLDVEGKFLRISSKNAYQHCSLKI
jgi:hypothetical protein